MTMMMRWRLQKVTEKKLEASYHRCLRRILWSPTKRSKSTHSI